ncbi:MAG: phosphotransferase family protein [Gaiellaceae bacterium]
MIAVDGLSRFARLPERLLAVSDPEAVRAALGRHVPELGSGELELRECKVERVRLKRGSLTALYRLTLAGEGPGQEHIELLGEILAPGASEPAPGPNRASFGADGWRCYLPELRLDLGLPPREPALPALPTLTDPTRARKLLEQAIRACSPAYSELHIEAARPQVVRAKGSRCTVLYELEFAPEDRDRGAPSPVVAKTYRGDKGENAYAGMRALWSSKLGPSGTVSIAEPLAFVPELNVLVQGPVQGKTTLKGLIKSAFAAGTPEALGELSAYVEKTAVGLAELHTSGVEYGKTVTWTDKLSDVRETTERLTVFAPELAGAAAPLLARLEEREAEHPADPPVPTHGSFRPNQVLLSAGEIGFIDFDRFGQAEPAVDVASFRTAVRDAGRLDPEQDGAARGESARSARLVQLDELCDRFLARYGAGAPISRERVELWEALGLFTTVLHCWTKMEAGLEARLEFLRHHLRTSGLA